MTDFPEETTPEPEDVPTDNGEDAPEGASSIDDDLAAMEADLGDSDVAEAHDRIAKLDDDLARARADLYNLNQEYGNYVRRSKESAGTYVADGQAQVVEALIGVLDDIDAARGHGDLEDGPFASIAQKLEDTLSTRFGLERFGAEGDAFDPEQHEALMANTSPDVTEPTVQQLLQPGYRMGDRVLRAAKVMVANPE